MASTAGPLAFDVSFASGDAFTFPVAPDRVSITKDGKTIPYSAVRTGDYPIAAGRQPEQVSFTVLLPGPGRSAFYPVPTDAATGQPETTGVIPLTGWQDPQVYIGLFEHAMEADRLRAYLSCADLDIGAWYQVLHTQQDFDSAQGGSFGDVSYTLTFGEERIPSVYTTDSTGAPSAQSGGGTTTSTATDVQSNGGPAPAPESPADQPEGALPTNQPATVAGIPTPGMSYVAQEGDTLTSIAVRAFGQDGNTAQHVADITSLNHYANPDLLLPGWIVNIPAS